MKSLGVNQMAQANTLLGNVLGVVDFRSRVEQIPQAYASLPAMDGVPPGGKEALIKPRFFIL